MNFWSLSPDRTTEGPACPRSDEAKAVHEFLTSARIRLLDPSPGKVFCKTPSGDRVFASWSRKEKPTGAAARNKDLSSLESSLENGGEDKNKRKGACAECREGVPRHYAKGWEFPRGGGTLAALHKTWNFQELWSL